MWKVGEDVCYPRRGSGGRIPLGGTLPLCVVCFEIKYRCSSRCCLLSQNPGGDFENCDLVSLLELGFPQRLSLWISQSAFEEMLDTTIAMWLGFPISKNTSELILSFLEPFISPSYCVLGSAHRIPGPMVLPGVK